MKRIVVIIVALIILLAIPATVYLVSQQQELRKKAAPATTLSLTPATTTANIGDTFSLEVVLDPGNNQVIATDIELIYDPDILEAQTITNSTLLPSVLTAGTVSRGTASITVGSSNVQTPVTARGTIAVVKFKTLAPTTSGAASVRFAQNSFVGGLGEGQTNLLVGSTPASVTVSGSATSTPTLTPTLTPAVTSTLTPTTTIRLTPTLTPTLSSTPSPTITATTSAVASSSAVQILTPATNTSVTTAEPTFTGKAPAGSTVTITIYSTPQTVVVQADSNGNWSYTPTTALDSGPHNVVASATDPSGTTGTATSSFVIAQAAGTGATESAIPISGDVSWTFILIFTGLTLLTLGFIYPIFL